MIPTTRSPGVSTMSSIPEHRCWRLLSTTTVGRLAFATDDGIVILPVNFIELDRRIYVRTEPGSTIASLSEGFDDVAFEVDYHDDLNQSGWNVLVKCTARVAGITEAERALRSTGRLGPWAPGERPLMIVLTPRQISGRKVAMRRSPRRTPSIIDADVAGPLPSDPS
ncbi:pyridoxamine 5'-phosphate oxidase family protein [Aeromicrobium terrae]|nr:pyridoxamine 5'-phosphate oxidase family protein [Aeromicrobium terrae]